MSMAKQLEAAIINSGNPFVEVFLTSLDCSLDVEIAQLRQLQSEIARRPDTEKDVSFSVLKKWLYGWKEADKCLSCLHLKSSEEWASGYYKAGRA
jgi:hypothetical protein